MRSLLILAVCGLAACVGPQTQVRDQAYVETLRLKISEVRNAIAETRATIAASRGAPYQPELQLRLAELLSEEARYHHRVAAEREQRAAGQLHVPQVRLLKEQAIGVYKSLLRNYPDSGLAEQARFNMAHEHRELGNYDDMRAILQELLKLDSGSQLASEALLVLGDYHFDKSELEEARSYYERVQASERGQRVQPLAHYKLAWVWVNQAECSKAIRQFERALVASRKATGEPLDERLTQGIDVRRAALVDMVYCYSQKRKAKGVLPYLRKQAHDRSTYVAALERMGRRFITMEEQAGAEVVLRELLRVGPTNRDRIDDARDFQGAIVAHKKFARAGADVALMTRVLSRYVTRADLTDEERQQARGDVEQLTRDILTRAQGRLLKRPANQQGLIASELAMGFRAYLDSFAEADARVEMLLNAGDVRVAAGDHYLAGRRALQAAMLLEEPDAARRDALYDAVVRFQEHLRQDPTAVGHLARSLARAALRKAGTELLRYELPRERERLVKFAIASSYYDGGELDEAIDALTAVAYEFSGTEEARASLRLVLDAYNTLNDFDGLVRAGRRFVGEGGPADTAMKAEIGPVLAAAEQRMIDDISLEAAGDEGGDLSVLLSVAKDNQGSDLGKRALLNAFVAARAQGDTKQLYELGDQMARDYPKDGQLPGMLSTLGQMAVGRFELDRALGFLEKAAQSGTSRRVGLLVTAAQLQEQLGDHQKARSLYEQAVRAADGRAKNEPLEKLAALLERTQDASAVLGTLRPHVEDGNPEIAARVGVALAATGDMEQAEVVLQSVLDAGSSASAAALSRAHYGMAEVLQAALEQYPALTDLDLVEEYVTVVDVTKQSYLNAAREGDAQYTPAALGRLAFMARSAAGKLGAADLSGAGLDDAQRKEITGALTQRAEALVAEADRARGECARQAARLGAFEPVVRRCLAGEEPKSIWLSLDRIGARSGAGTPKDAEALRQALAKNPDDLSSLRTLGERFLDAGDPHVARLVFLAAQERGGGPMEANLLGLAAHAAGNLSEALAAFSNAAKGGLEAGRQNLASALRSAGLNDAAKQALERYPQGREGGRGLK